MFGSGKMDKPVVQIIFRPGIGSSLSRVGPLRPRTDFINQVCHLAANIAIIIKTDKHKHRLDTGIAIGYVGKNKK